MRVNVDTQWEPFTSARRRDATRALRPGASGCRERARIGDGCSSTARSALLLETPKLRAAHLPGLRPWQRVEVLDLARILVGCHLALDKLLEFCRQTRRAPRVRRQLDERFHELAPKGVGLADDP